jgi:uncharacterized protein YdaU (DUF1376 family)
MSFDWFPWFPIKFRRKTRHLGLAEDGAYRRLIDEYMTTGEPLPDNDVALARIIGVSLDEWMAVASTLRPFFEASNGRLINKTCEEELHTQAMQTHSTRIKNQKAANTRWAKHRELKEIHARALHMQSERNASRMQNDATRQDIRKKEGEPNSARSLATALPTGALPREPQTEQAEKKRPSELTRTELESSFTSRRAAPS